MTSEAAKREVPIDLLRGGAAECLGLGSFRPLTLQCTPLPPASVHYSYRAAPKRLAARQG